MNEPTLKQWKRRALAAEAELATIQKLRQFDAQQEMDMARKMDVMTLARISRHRDLKILLNTYYRESADQIAARL